MRICNGHGQRIGRICARNRHAGQQHFHHRGNLVLFGAPGAHNRLLYQPRGMFVDAQIVPPARRQHRAAGLREFEGGLRIGIDEHFLGGGTIGRILPDHGCNRAVQVIEPGGHWRLGIRLDFTIGNVADPRAFAADHTPAGAGQ